MQQATFPNKVWGLNRRPQRWEASVLSLHRPGPWALAIMLQLLGYFMSLTWWGYTTIRIRHTTMDRWENERKQYILVGQDSALWTTRHLRAKTHILFVYLGFYVTFNTVQVISRRVVGRAEETSTYSSLGFCTVNCRPTASNYQLSHLRPWQGSNPGRRGGRRECYHSATVAPTNILTKGRDYDSKLARSKLVDDLSHIGPDRCVRCMVIVKKYCCWYTKILFQYKRRSLQSYHVAGFDWWISKQ